MTWIKRRYPPRRKTPMRWGRRLARGRAMGRPTHRGMVKTANNLWRRLIYAKEPTGVCPRCRQRKWVEAAHGFTKGAYPALRFELDNGIPLCRTCHRRVDSDHHAKVELWVAYIGEERYERLRLMAQARSKTDVALVIVFLQRELDKHVKMPCNDGE